MVFLDNITLFDGNLYKESELYIQKLSDIRWEGMYDYQVLTSSFFVQFIKHRVVPKICNLLGNSYCGKKYENV